MLNQRFADGVLRQHQEIDALHERLDRLIRSRRGSDGDRIWYPFVDHVQFLQDDNSARDVIFQIPEGVLFEAERFVVYPGSRFVTTDEATHGPDEVVFRPCVMSTYEGVFAEDGETATFADDPAAIDCRIQLSETYIDENGRQKNRSYQNMPFPSELLFAGAVNRGPSNRTSDRVGAVQGDVDTYYNNFQFPSGLVFDVPWCLKGGSSVQVKLAPNFANARNASDLSSQNEYRLTVVLDGFKVAR